MRYLLDRKEQESVFFCRRGVSAQEDPGKKIFFQLFNHGLTKEGSMKQYNLWSVGKAMMRWKSLIKFAHNILRQFLLDFCQTFCNFNQTSKNCLKYGFSISRKLLTSSFQRHTTLVSSVQQWKDNVREKTALLDHLFPSFKQLQVYLLNKLEMGKEILLLFS